MQLTFVFIWQLCHSCVAILARASFEAKILTASALESSPTRRLMMAALTENTA